MLTDDRKPGSAAVQSPRSVAEPAGDLVPAGEGTASRPEAPGPVVSAGDLRDTVEWYRSLTEAITDYTYTVALQNGQPVETTHSPTSKAVIGYTQKDFDADPFLWITMVPAEDREAVKTQAAELLAGRRPEPLEHRLVRKDGTTIWVESHLVPRYSKDGPPVEYTGVVKDITRRRRAEERRASDDAARALGEVAGSVAHEVRNPLNAILVALELLDQEFTSEPDREACRMHLSRIGRQVGRLKMLMDDLLRLREPVAVERLEALPLGEFCRNTVGEWQSGSSPERGIVFHMADEAKALSIRGDAFRLSQALTNLLNNAAAHTPSAGSIEFRLEATPAGEARIRIVDAGEGIPPEKLEEVFSPFYTSRRGGTGLGLNLVRRIVEQHDGTVALYNNGDRPGCTAEILLPLGCRGA